MSDSLFTSRLLTSTPFRVQGEARQLRGDREIYPGDLTGFQWRSMKSLTIRDEKHETNDMCGCSASSCLCAIWMRPPDGAKASAGISNNGTAVDEIEGPSHSTNSKGKVSQHDSISIRSIWTWVCKSYSDDFRESPKQFSPTGRQREKMNDV